MFGIRRTIGNRGLQLNQEIAVARRERSTKLRESYLDSTHMDVSEFANAIRLDPPIHPQLAMDMALRLPAELVISTLLELALDGDPNRRARAVSLLSSISPAQAVLLAVKLLDDGVDFVRWYAVRVLREQKYFAVADRILWLMINDRSEAVRDEAAFALGTLGSLKHIAAMEERLPREKGVDHELVPITEGIRSSIAAIKARGRSKST